MSILKGRLNSNNELEVIDYIRGIRFPIDVAPEIGTAFVMKAIKAKYDFSVDGGTTGDVTLAETATLPDNAVVVGGYVNSTTAVTSGGAATVSVGTTAGSSDTSILGATAKASLSADAVIVSASDATPFKMTAEGDIQITVGTADLTAGVIEIVVFYFIAGS